jgi:2'-5' RNA ligase
VTASPLVVTLTVDQDTQDAWDALRRTWFPLERLVVGAHLTLFHALPGEFAGTVLADCSDVAGGTPAFSLAVAGVRSLGRGVALAVSAPELPDLHATLGDRWRPWLTPQDRQPLRPHVTIQNKVDARVAAATMRVVRENFGPATARATGIAVWRYLGGPWEPVTGCRFRD